jgi:hypothetical protein
MRKQGIIAACAVLAVTVALDAQDQFKAARDLYASAAFEDALTALTHVREAGGAAADSEQVEQYRAFCLFALGRTSEAEAVAEALIQKDPLMQLDALDASPRIAAMFVDVRKRLLPRLIREQYRSARAAIERKEFTNAEPQLVRVGRMIDEAAKLGATDETTADLRVLTDGFLELARSANPPAPAPSGSTGGHTAAATGEHGAAAPSDAAISEAPTVPAVYGGASAGVTAPVALYQEFPVVPRALANVMAGSDKKGIVDVLIDEKGDVERVTVRESINSMYDTLVLNAARHWKYQPALKSGAPVKFLKSIGITMQANVPAQPDGMPEPRF